MSESGPADPPRILSTLNEDGTRRWLRPRPSPGRFLVWRRVVAYLLIVAFAGLPYMRMNGKPPILLDIMHREFTFFGTTFYPTDTLLLALLVVTIFLSVFFVTALAGRVWCGWACPQTVYMEFLYRPIERLLEGVPGRKARTGAWRKPVKYLLFILASMFLAHTFLAYFVGVDQLLAWVRSSPGEHPVAFFVMALVTALMLFDFGFFREQVCLVACPYGRFQSVMLDRSSLTILYDAARGEPRGRKKRAKGADVALDVVGDAQGDCIDCKMCVTTCPTGIDIRNGPQMECIGCAQCIDACDSIMDKVGRPRGLVRYSSQEAMERGRRHLLRPRVVIYPTLISVLLTALIVLLATRADAVITLMRGRGAPYAELPDGTVATQIIVKVRNNLPSDQFFTISVTDPSQGAIAESEQNPLLVRGGDQEDAHLSIVSPRRAFPGGINDLTVRIEGSSGFADERHFRMTGPTYRERSANGDSSAAENSDASQPGGS